MRVRAGAKLRGEGRDRAECGRAGAELRREGRGRAERGE